jgi:hypothetical protein
MLKSRKKTMAPESVYQLKVTLLYSQPPIWRRFQVQSAVTLQRLHRILQVVMGWTDSHMHGFRVPRHGQRGARRQLLPIEGADEKSTRLADLLRRPRDRVIYEYDFGDGWEHEIVLEDVVARSPAARYPIVLSGQGACPPDDVGGLVPAIDSESDNLMEVRAMRDKTISATEAARSFSEVLNQVQYRDRSFSIERRSKVVALLTANVADFGRMPGVVVVPFE